MYFDAEATTVCFLMLRRMTLGGQLLRAMPPPELRNFGLLDYTDDLNSLVFLVFPLISGIFTVEFVLRVMYGCFQSEGQRECVLNSYRAMSSVPALVCAVSVMCLSIFSGKTAVHLSRWFVALSPHA